MAFALLIVVSEEHFLEFLEFPVFFGCYRDHFPAIEGLNSCYPSPEVGQTQLKPDIVESEGIDHGPGTFGQFENHR